MTRQSYAPEIRIIRLMCTGRVDLAFVIRAFQKGADGVIIGGCWPGECHYVTEGNYDALGQHAPRQEAPAAGRGEPRAAAARVDRRLRGARFAEVMSDFVKQVGELGPLGQGEAIERGDLQARLDAVTKLVPYVKLVEREKLSPPTRNEERDQRLLDRPRRGAGV